MPSLASSCRATLVALGLLHVLTACEPSLIVDENGRGSGGPPPSQTSGGAGTSPRWAANNPSREQTTDPPNVDAGAPMAASSGPVSPPWGGAGAAATGGVTQEGATPSLEDSRSVQQPQAPASHLAEPDLAPPGESCAAPCRSRWQQCFSACGQRQDAQCTAACDEPYRDCMRGCY